VMESFWKYLSKGVMQLKKCFRMKEMSIG
jgi:hypothetical protein